MTRIILLAALSTGLGLAATAPSGVTFTKDVLPVLQKNCQNCHRPGEAAPMSFLDYQHTRPWAKAIRAAVLSQKMPPWFADARFGHFSNAPAMTNEDIQTLVAWADSGAREGDPSDAPAPRKFTEGWQIGQPDMVIEMPHEVEVPASGTVEYQYVVMPIGFAEDRWVQATEARPGNKAVVHHIIAFIREPGSAWLKDAKPGIPFVPTDGSREGASVTTMLSAYAPGMVPQVLKPGQARLLKAGSDVVFQMHYTTNGKAGKDRSKIGLIFAKAQPSERVLTVTASNSKFVIPPGDPNYQVDSSLKLLHEAELVDLLPHMHLRGKDFEYRAVYPNGETETLLSIPHYNFGWQLTYFPAEQKVLPAGTVIQCTAHFDNSANNAFNPDPTKEVRFGEQTWEEMMSGIFDVAVPLDVTVKDLIPPKKPAVPPTSTAAIPVAPGVSGAPYR